MFPFRSILNRTNPILRPINLSLRYFSHLQFNNQQQCNSFKFKRLKSNSSLQNYSSKSSNSSNGPNNSRPPYNRPNYAEEIRRSKDMALYGVTIVLLALALTYASVPIYRLYCQATGKGGKARVAEDFLANKVKRMKKNKEKLINVLFIADKESRMRWSFKPTQDEINVYPGETALAFFTAKNPTDQPVNGVSTYSVAPVEAGQYLNKIQCFCFEEQRLDPGEEVDMPVFFYFDPEFADDPRLENVSQVTLAYTFFESKDNKSTFTFPNFRSVADTTTASAPA